MPVAPHRRTILAAIAFVPVLAACIPAIIAGGAAATLISVHDRRSTGTQADDETSEWKGSNRLPSQYRELSHVNFTAFNRRLLITGEVPNEEARQTIGNIAVKIEGIRLVHNELQLAPSTSLTSRSNDALISSKFKARLVDSSQISANHLKPMTENGTLFLMGLVSEREAKVAVMIARTTAGVRKVVDLLEILPDEEIHRLDNALLGRPRPASAPAPVENR